MGISRRFKLFLGIIIPIFGFFLMSQNTFALTKGYTSFSTQHKQYNSNSFVATPALRYKEAQYNVKAIRSATARVSGQDTVPTNANYMSVTGKYNILTWTDLGNIESLPDISNLPAITFVSINGNNVTFESSSTKVLITDFRCDPLNVLPGNQTVQCRTFTVQFSFVVRNQLPNTITNLNNVVAWSDGVDLSTSYAYGFNYYFEYDSNNNVNVDFSFDYSSALQTQQIQIQNITNTNLELINNTNAEYYDANYQAIDNINGQSSSDMPNSSDQQTTNLIGIISTFVSTIAGYGTGSSCSISLPFPQFAGGTQVVNVCNSRDKLSMNNLNYVVIFANLGMICFFVPICFILLRMIYKEIRSWTNG